MITPAFYFEVASRNAADWLAERDAYSSFDCKWFEVLVEYPHLLSDFGTGEFETLTTMLKGKRISFHGATLNLSLLSLNEAIVGETTKVLADQLVMAKKLGCDTFTFHAGEYPYFFERVRSRLHEALASNLQGINEVARSLGIQLCIENLKNPNTYPRTIRDLNEVFCVLPGLGFALDVRHACVVGENPSELVREFGRRLRAIHFRADCGLSENDLKIFIRDLEEVEFDGPFIIEDPSLNQLDKSSRALLHRARSMLNPYMTF
jgi:sugar phosphate isomerase/epimerase